MWELDVQNYVRQSGKVIQDESRIAVILDRAPNALTALVAGGHRDIEAYERLRNA